MMLLYPIVLYCFVFGCIALYCILLYMYCVVLYTAVWHGVSLHYNHAKSTTEVIYQLSTRRLFIISVFSNLTVVIFELYLDHIIGIFIIQIKGTNKPMMETGLIPPLITYPRLHRPPGTTALVLHARIDSLIYQYGQMGLLGFSEGINMSQCMMVQTGWGFYIVSPISTNEGRRYILNTLCAGY